MSPTERLFSLIRVGASPELPMDQLLYEIDALIDAGADLRATDRWRQRPLQLACLRPSPRLLEHLITRGADVEDLNRLDRQGNAPLHQAARQPCVPHIRFFLRLGANPNGLNYLKQTPMKVARAQIRRRRWVLERLLGPDAEAREKTLSLIDEYEEVLVLLEAQGGLAHDPDRVAVFKQEAASHVGPTTPGFTLREQDFDSVEEVAVWMKEHDVPVDEVAVALASKPATKTVSDEGAEEASVVVTLSSFHHGDLHVKSSLDVSSAFVVTGDLVVDGVLSDFGPDSYVAVGGTVRARGITTSGDVRVGGDVHADVVHGSYNDQVFKARTLHCRVLLIDDHWFDVGRACELEIDLLDHDPLTSPRVFKADMLKGPGHINVTAVFDALRAGADVFSDPDDEPAHAQALPFEDFEKWLKSYRGNQREKLALIKQHWTMTLRHTDPKRVERSLARAIKSPKLRGELALFLGELLGEGREG